MIALGAKSKGRKHCNCEGQGAEKGADKRGGESLQNTNFVNLAVLPKVRLKVVDCFQDGKALNSKQLFS